VDVAFTGSKCELIARTGNKFGIARVSVDGGAYSDIDLYTSASVYNSSVWHTTGLAQGPHTLRIEWTGRQNAASTANTIDIDAFDVSGAPTLTRVEQEDASFTWAGTWPLSSSASFSGGTYRSTTASGSVSVSFSGTAVALIARTGNKFGIARVAIDGGAWTDVDLYTATTAYQAVAWRSATLAPGPHTLRIAWTGRMNAASTSNMIDVDAVDVTGTTGVLTQAL
jgi:aminopeptidase N